MDRLPAFAHLAQSSAASSLSGHFKPLDWIVLVGYLALVSVLGVLLAGRQRDLKDFFRGGNRLAFFESYEVPNCFFKLRHR